MAVALQDRHRESLGSNPALLSPTGPGAIGLSQGRSGQQLGKLGSVEEGKLKDKPERAAQTAQSRKAGSERVGRNQRYLGFRCLHKTLM